MSWKKHLTKLCKKCPLHLKYVLALPWEIWSDRLSRQRSTYMYIVMNHWIATNTTGVIASKIVKRVVRYISYIIHARNVRLQCADCVPRSQMSANWNDASWMSEHTVYCVVGDVVVVLTSTCLRSCWRHTFRAYDVKMMWRTNVWRFLRQ